MVVVARPRSSLNNGRIQVDRLHRYPESRAPASDFCASIGSSQVPLRQLRSAGLSSQETASTTHRVPVTYTIQEIAYAGTQRAILATP